MSFFAQTQRRFNSQAGGLDGPKKVKQLTATDHWPRTNFVPRTILAFNGDLESRLALHWLVHERGYEVVTLSIDLGQEIYLEPLGELALELGATAAQVLDRREMFLDQFALPVLEADAV